MEDRILESIFLDVGLWSEVIEHGLRRGMPRYVVAQLQDPHFRADLCDRIADREYQISPPHTGYRAKEGGGERMFLANEPLDRLLLNAIYKWLLRNESAMIHPSCLSYQEGVGIGRIVRQLSQQMSSLETGCENGIVGRKFDIHKYFESVGRTYIHQAFDRVEQHYGHSAVIDMLRDYYDSDVYFDSRRHEPVEAYQGIKQGCAISSWLANVLLFPLDEAMSRLPGCYLRYSDDIIYVGKDYETATRTIEQHLKQMGLSLNARKIEDVTTSDFVRFLGYGLRGSEITLSGKWVKTFQRNIDRLTIKDARLIKRVRNIRRKGGANMHAELDAVLAKASRKVIRYLYYGDGQHAWASLALGIINREQDLLQLSLYCTDALRAVYTGKTQIGGLGFSVSAGILRGKGRNVNANRLATARLSAKSSASADAGWLDGYYSLLAMQRNKSNPWLYRAIVRHLLATHSYPKYLADEAQTMAATGACEAAERLEERYDAFLNSQPDGEDGMERFFAKTLDDMDMADLLTGMPRSEARYALGEWLEHQLDFGDLQPSCDAWFWQSERFPQLVLLREWFV